VTGFNVLFQNLSGRYKENHRKPVLRIADLYSKNQNRSPTYEAERGNFKMLLRLFYHCTVHSEICKVCVHSLTNALFIKLGKV
jgi:hypothetical protein